jgi:hypothetical protein
MPRVGAERISELALDAVDEAAAEALRAPIRRTEALAVALAWLLHFGRPNHYSRAGRSLTSGMR